MGHTVRGVIPMGSKRSVAVLLSTLLVSGCASKGDLDLVRRDTEELKARFFALEKDMDGVRTESREKTDLAKKEILSEVEKVRGEFSQIRKTAADLQARLDAEREGMRALSGKLDDVSIALKKPAEDIALLREETDRKIASLTDRLVEIEKRLADLTAARVTEVRKQSEATPEDQYKNALERYQKGEYGEARAILTDFLKKNPDHDLAANAQYWIGETWFSEKNYEQAILAFQDVIKNYPGKEKIPAAMLKQGMSFAELGDTKSARFIYRKLVEDFPKSEEAKKGAEKLKTLK